MDFYNALIKFIKQKLKDCCMIFAELDKNNKTS